MEKRKIKKLVIKEIPKSQKSAEIFVKVYEDSENSLIYYLRELSRFKWNEFQNLHNLPEEAIEKGINILHHIRLSLVGPEYGKEKKLDFKLGKQEEQKLREIKRYYQEEGYDAYFIDPEAEKDFWMAIERELEMILAPDYFVDFSKENIKAKIRNQHIINVYIRLNEYLKNDASQYLVNIMTGKICEEFGIIKSLEEKESYSDHKDYYRQTIRNAINNALKSLL